MTIQQYFEINFVSFKLMNCVQCSLYIQVIYKYFASQFKQMIKVIHLWIKHESLVLFMPYFTIFLSLSIPIISGANIITCVYVRQ